MKRTLGLFITISLLAVASLLWAQVASQGTLKTPTGDRTISIVQQGPHTFVAADEVVSTLGGTIAADQSGFRLSLGGSEAVLGPDSRYAVVRDELIEMPAPPLVIEGRAFVPWQFFRGVLPITSELDALWAPASRTLLIRPMPREVVYAQISVVDLQEISKMVIQLSSKVDYVLTREGDRYFIRFRRPIRPPFAEKAYDSAHIARILASENEIQVEPRTPEVIADSYSLEKPHRIVLDFRPGATVPMPQPGGSPAGRPIHLPGIRTIVLDPGHGGKEVGAIGPNGLLEKDTTLTICQKLAELLGEKLHARVILTRTDDSVVGLEERTALANRYKADLFLSVHLNSSLVKGAHGTETYFLSLEASDEQARNAAERENLP
ncbi:MAG TPA: N-acetylmuramoyl-L-alanine amidase, partial [Thermoanaerobaculia bacterium]